MNLYFTPFEMRVLIICIMNGNDESLVWFVHVRTYWPQKLFLSLCIRPLGCIWTAYVNSWDRTCRRAPLPMISQVGVSKIVDSALRFKRMEVRRSTKLSSYIYLHHMLLIINPIYIHMPCLLNDNHQLSIYVYIGKCTWQLRNTL